MRRVVSEAVQPRLFFGCKDSKEALSLVGVVCQRLLLIVGAPRAMATRKGPYGRLQKVVDSYYNTSSNRIEKTRIEWP